MVWPADVLMGTSAWLVWTSGGWEQHKFAISVYAVQLLLNFLWVGHQLTAPSQT